MLQLLLGRRRRQASGHPWALVQLLLQLWRLRGRGLLLLVLQGMHGRHHQLRAIECQGHPSDCLLRVLGVDRLLRCMADGSTSWQLLLLLLWHTWIWCSSGCGIRWWGAALLDVYDRGRRQQQPGLCYYP
jgi:hypothetical protein